MKLLEHFKELSLYPKNTEEVKGLILQLAVEGKLTVNWRKENPGIKDASELFDQVRIRSYQEDLQPLCNFFLYKKVLP